MSEMVERVARAMEKRASQPLANLESLEDVLVGSLGDAWWYLAYAAIAAMHEPTEAMLEPASELLLDGHIEIEAAEANARGIWRAMIRGALGDE